MLDFTSIFQKKKEKQLVSPLALPFQKCKHLLGIVLVAVLVLVPLTASAQAGGGFSDIIQNPEVEKIMSGLFAVSSKIQEFLHSILWWVLLTIGALLQNDLLYRGPMEAKLLELWVYIRDVVNVLFVLILLGIALYNVVRGPDENFQIKTILPKFVIALIAVNFSFLGIKVVLDGVNIVSTGIFGLPHVVQEKLEFEGSSGKAFCEGIYGTTSYIENVQKETAQGGALCTEDYKINYSNENARQYFTTFNSRNAALVLAINLQKIDLLNKVYVPENQKTIGTLALNSMFSVLFYIIYAAAFVALMCVLLARLVVLWLMIVLSPLMALMMVLPDSIKSNIGGGKDIGKEFVKHAIVPIPVALVMSIGFIMFKTFEKTTFADSTLSFATLNTSVLISGITTLQQFIGAIGTVAFIWMGTFDAMKGTYADGIVDGVKNFVKGTAGTLGKIPTLIPMFPVGDGTKVALASMLHAPRALQGLVEDAKQKRFGKDFPGLAGGPTEGADKLSRVLGRLDNKDVKQAFGENYEHRLTPTGKDAIANYLKKNKNFITQGNLPAGVGKVDDFIKELESGNASEAMVNEFYRKNNLIPQGTPAPKPEDKASSSSLQGGQALASNYHLDGRDFNALQNRSNYGDILDVHANKKLTDPEKAKLNELAEALNSNNEAKVKEIMEGPEKDKIKENLKKLADVGTQQSEFAGQIMNVKDKTFKEPKEYFNALDGIFQQEYQNLTGEAFKPENFADPKKITPERKKALEIIQRDMAQLTQQQKDSLAKAEGYKNSLTEVVFITPPEAKPAPGGGKK